MWHIRSDWQKTMRYFQTLDYMVVDDETGIMTLGVRHNDEMVPQLSLRREGAYMAISAGYGPVELALRPRYDELTRLLARLQPVEGLQTTRQVGSSNSYLAIGLRGDGSLVLRPTLVADATGQITFNLLLTSDVRQTLFDALSVIANSENDV